MEPVRFTTLPGDRRSDPRLRAGAIEKPPILSRRTQRWLALTALALIVWGTLGPLGTGHHPWLRTPDAWSWSLPLPHSDFNDYVTNVFVYIPVGIALRLLIRRRGNAGWGDFLLTVGLACLLSYVTELLQQAMPARTTSRTDFYVNTAGAGLGALLAVPLQAVLRGVHASTWLRVHFRRGAWCAFEWLAIIAALLYMTSPWDPKRPDFRFDLDVPVHVADPAFVWRFFVFAAIGYLRTGKAIARGDSPATSAWGTVFRVAVFVCLLEGLQAVLGAKVSSLMQAFIATFGSALGAITAGWMIQRGPSADELEEELYRDVPEEPAAPMRSQFRPAPGPRGPQVPPAPIAAHDPMAAAVVAGAAGGGVRASGGHGGRPGTRAPAPGPGRGTPEPLRRQPGEPPMINGAFRWLVSGALLAAACYPLVATFLRDGRLAEFVNTPQVQWIPFYGEFSTNFLTMTSSVMQECLLFGFMTACTLLLTRGRQPALALAFIVGYVGLLEGCQAFVAHRTADTTTLILAAAAWLVALKAWNSIYPAALTRPPLRDYGNAVLGTAQ
jgi:VanZ family protein